MAHVDLTTIDYFKNMNYSTYIDSLTNVINRENIINYTKELIANGNPFALAIINVDNFKLLNDSYGTHVGDIVLSQFATILKNGVGLDALVGRQNGDQFIAIFHGEHTYDSIHKRLKSLMDEHIRIKNDLFQSLNISITATIGCALFPSDASDYDTLLMKATKALFRGKTKGRNCFIIYVDEKHKNIEMRKNVEITTSAMQEIHSILTNPKKDLNKKAVEAMGYILNFLSLSHAYLYINGKVLYKNIGDGKDLGIPNFNDLKELLDEQGIINVNNYSDYKETKRSFHMYCGENHIYSCLIKEVTFAGAPLGYLMFADTKIKRIWQQNDRNMVAFLAYELSFLLNK